MPFYLDAFAHFNISVKKSESLIEKRNWVWYNLGSVQRILKIWWV